MVTIEKLTLKQARQLAGKSQREVAEDFGVTVRTLGSWEHGRHLPTVETFLEICRYYGVSADDIILSCHKSKL